MADGTDNRTAPRHLARRAPRKAGGFSWGRFPVEDGRAVSWRLFRRDLTGRLYPKVVDAKVTASRAELAAEVWRARIALRKQVDEIVLGQLGVSNG